MRQDLRLLVPPPAGALANELKRLHALLAQVELRNQALRQQVAELRAELRQQRRKTKR